MDELPPRPRARLQFLHLAGTLAALAFVAACGDSSSPSQPSTASSASAVSNPLPPAGPVTGGFEVLVGAGDIARCGPDLVNAEATARLVDAIGGTVFTTGDNTQVAGTAQEFRDCYAPTWGRVVERTRPAPGNHDMQTAGGAAYYDYFGGQAGPAGLGYYSYDLGAWHIISLNGNVSMKAGSAQANWLRQDLQASRSLCTLAYWHQPLFSSGLHGNDATSAYAWQLLYDYGAEVVLNGHDHLFERFAPQDPTGRRDDARGIRQFTVGTGGNGLDGVLRLQPNSEAQGAAHGVLKLTLEADSYLWQFISVSGSSFADSGRGTCHAR
jgi:hypothetical protein